MNKRQVWVVEGKRVGSPKDVTIWDVFTSQDAALDQCNVAAKRDLNRFYTVTLYTPEGAMTNPNTRLADELRQGGIALIAEAVASLRSVTLELNENATCRMVMHTDSEWLAKLRECVAAIPPGNVAQPEPTALDDLRKVPGATGRDLPCVEALRAGASRVTGEVHERRSRWRVRCAESFTNSRTAVHSAAA